MSFKPNLAINSEVLRDFMSLPQPKDKVQVSYVWVSGKKDGTKFKCRTLAFNPQSLAQVPEWASGYRLTGEHGEPTTAETILKPVALYNDPFRKGSNKIVLCEMLKYDRTP